MAYIDNTNSPKFIQLPIAEVDAAVLIRQLSNDNFHLRQVVDKMANTLAIQQVLIQQLRDEIANLKGQKPKPKIPPSKLEGQNRKPDWHKRIGLHDNQRKTVLFSMWVKSAKNLDAPSLHSCNLPIAFKIRFGTIISEYSSLPRLYE
ncbi:MAG: hypothetical protein H0T62_00905 [Parachlamydiaceae bacterium]|nr:hypothetical protein [Parachlamydiaceae bacterium]